MRNRIAQSVLITLCFFVFFVAGWISSLYSHSGEQAMGCLMSSVSAMRYLEKGDDANAKLMMQLSVEGNVPAILKYGTPLLDWHYPDARGKWLQRYADIRYSNPAIEYADGGEYRKKIDEMLPQPSSAEEP